MSEGVPLATRTTLRVGGPARVFVECTTTDDLIGAVRAVAGTPMLLLGGGSNVLVSDAGYDGTVVHVGTSQVTIDGTCVRVDAGAVWDDVVAATVAAGLGGLECLSGIPGSAGATPVQNVGAYGVEVATLLRRVQLLDRTTGEVSWAAPAALELGYRTSNLKHTDRAVVLAVEFGLHDDGLSEPLRYRELAGALGAAEGERRPAADVRAAVLALRGGKGMVLDPADHDTWSAGSFFTNPVVSQSVADSIDGGPRYPASGGVKLSAGWLIEHAGFAKGFPGPDAPARLSTKHTLALTNRGTATAADLVALARRVRDGVWEKYGVRLEPEPVPVGITL